MLVRCDVNGKLHVSGMFAQKQENDPIKQDIDPINDPINIDSTMKKNS